MGLTLASRIIGSRGHPSNYAVPYLHQKYQVGAKYGGTVRNGIEFLKRQFAQELNIAESDHELKPIPAQLEKSLVWPHSLGPSSREGPTGRPAWNSTNSGSPMPLEAGNLPFETVFKILCKLPERPESI